MKEQYVINNDNIDAISNSWNRRETISSISIQLDHFLKEVETFGIILLWLIIF